MEHNVTLEAGQLGNDEEEYQQEVAKELSVQLQKLILIRRLKNPCWSWGLETGR